MRTLAARMRALMPGLGLLGVAFALTSMIYGDERTRTLGPLLCVLIGGLLFALFPLTFAGARPLSRRFGLLLGGAVLAVGALLLVWNKSPSTLAARIVWIIVGFAAYWVLVLFTNRRPLLFDLDKNSDPGKMMGGRGARLEWPDRVALVTVLAAILLALLNSVVATCWGIVVSTLAMLAGAIATVAGVSTRSEGSRFARPPSGMAWAGLILVWFGLVWAAPGIEDRSESKVMWGWLAIGAGAGFSVWLSTTYRMLSSFAEETRRTVP